MSSIYDAIGGDTAVSAAVDGFYRRVLADPALAPFFTGVDTRHLKAHQRAFIAAALGGPDIYAGRDMATAHTGLGISDAEFSAVAGHLAAELASLGVPPETVTVIMTALGPLRDVIVGA